MEVGGNGSVEFFIISYTSSTMYRVQSMFCVSLVMFAVARSPVFPTRKNNQKETTDNVTKQNEASSEEKSKPYDGCHVSCRRPDMGDCCCFSGKKGILSASQEVPSGSEPRQSGRQEEVPRGHGGVYVRC